jgi:hypothetical protein
VIARRRSSDVAVFVPSRDNRAEEFDRAPWVEKFVLLMTKAFRGAFEETVVGYWVTSDDELIKEATSIVISLAGAGEIKAYAATITELAIDFGIETRQEAVMLLINGALHTHDRKAMRAHLKQRTLERIA